MKNTLCFSACGKNPFKNAPRGSQMIELRQQGRDRFSVRYGLELKERLTYSEAAHQLGACIMHDAACESRLDNRIPGER